jgi:hypothetical protein
MNDPLVFATSAEMRASHKAIRAKFKGMPGPLDEGINLRRKPIALSKPAPVVRKMAAPPVSDVPLYVEPIYEPSIIYGRRPTGSEIKQIVSAHYGVTLAEIEGQPRSHKFLNPRHIAMYLCRHLAGMSLPQIGRLFGNRDHTTVLNACRRIEKTRETDSLFASCISAIERKISGEM